MAEKLEEASIHSWYERPLPRALCKKHSTCQWKVKKHLRIHIVPIWRQVFVIYKRDSSCDNETFQFQISNTVFSGSLSTVILWTTNGIFHVSASFWVCPQNCRKHLLNFSYLSTWNLTPPWRIFLKNWFLNVFQKISKNSSFSKIKQG